MVPDTDELVRLECRENDRHGPLVALRWVAGRRAGPDCALVRCPLTVPHLTVAWRVGDGEPLWAFDHDPAREQIRVTPHC